MKTNLFLWLTMILTKNIYKASYFRAFDRCFTSGWLTSGSRFLFFLSQQKAVFMGLGVLLAHNLAIFAPILVEIIFLFLKILFIENVNLEYFNEHIKNIEFESREYKNIYGEHYDDVKNIIDKDNYIGKKVSEIFNEFSKKINSSIDFHWDSFLE